MACKNCGNNNCDCEGQYCNCGIQLSTICITYDGVKLNLIDTYTGQNLESILKNIEELFQTLFDFVQNKSHLNIGTGAKVYKKTNAQSQIELRTISSTSSVDVTENENDITVGVNEVWLLDFVTNNTSQTTTTITETIVGKKIAKYTNEVGAQVNINESITTLVNNGNGSFTYTNENSIPTTIDFSAEETTTTFFNLITGHRIATYINEQGNNTNINETVTTLTNIGNSTFRYTNESGTQTTYVPLTTSTANLGIVELATNTETQTGTDNTRAVTPAGLSSRTATETRTGILEVATQTEANALVVDDKIITPAKIPLSTTTQKGIIEIATQTEVDAGTDNTRAVTPLTLKNSASATPIISKEYVNTITTWSNGQAISMVHGFGDLPKMIYITLVAKNSIHTYSPGEEIMIANQYSVRPDTPQFSGISVTATTGTIYLKIGLNIFVPTQPKTTAGNSDRDLFSDSTNFSIRVRAYG